LCVALHAYDIDIVYIYIYSIYLYSHVIKIAETVYIYSIQYCCIHGARISFFLVYIEYR
jgi:hypothetical protein